MDGATLVSDVSVNDAGAHSAHGLFNRETLSLFIIAMAGIVGVAAVTALFWWRTHF